MPVYFVRETIDTKESRETQLNRNSRDLQREVIQTLGLTLPGAPQDEPKADKNRFNLVDGNYPGMAVTKTNTHINALTAEATFTTQLYMEQNALIDGVLFHSGPRNRAALAVVGAGRTCVLRNCVFEKVEEDTSFHIELADANAKMIAIGCIFRGPSKTSTILTNPGIAANAVFVGCFDETGNGYGTSTQVGCL